MKGSRSIDREPFVYAGTIRHRLKPWLLYALVLVLASICVFGQMLAAPGSTVVGAPETSNDDSSLFIWWLAHAAQVLTGLFTGQAEFGDFLHTEAMNAVDGGVNGAWNTSLLGPSLLLAPITILAGPILAFNLFIISLPVLGSLAAAVLFRRFLTRIPAFSAGAGVGFSSYVIAQSAGHPNLAYAVTPPLVAAGLLALLDGHTREPGHRRRFWSVVLGLGLVMAVQFYVSTEVLAGTFLAACCFVVCLLFFHRTRRHRRYWRRMVVGGGAASVLALVLACPLLLAMLGPGAPRAAIRPHGVWNTDLFDFVIPAAPTLLGTGASPLPRQAPIDPAELGAYLGVPALLVCMLVVLTLGRRGPWVVPVRLAAGTGLLLGLLSLGSPVFLGGREILPFGPFVLIEHLPVLTNLLPMRLVLYTSLAAWALLGCGLEWGLTHRHTRRGQALLALLGVSALCVMPGAQPAREVYVPEFYTRSVAEVLPDDAVVKTLPQPLAWAVPHADEAMVWQAVSGMRYREVGGYFIGSDAMNPILYSAPEDTVDGVLGDALITGHKPIDPAGSLLRQAAEELRAEGVDAIVFAPQAPIVSGAADEFTAYLDVALGEADYVGEGVRVYLLDDLGSDQAAELH